MEKSKRGRLTLQERFDAKWVEAPETGCHLWTAAKFKNGYGKIGIDGSARYAHRVAWELAHGPVPDGMFVLHSCDVRACVRHLFLGTQADNMADMRAKGRESRGASHAARLRATLPRGAQHHNCTLTASRIAMIFTLRARGLPHRKIAEAVGCSSPHVSHVLSGKRRTRDH